MRWETSAKRGGESHSRTKTSPLRHTDENSPRVSYVGTPEENGPEAKAGYAARACVPLQCGKQQSRKCG